MYIFMCRALYHPDKDLDNTISIDTTNFHFPHRFVSRWCQALFAMSESYSTAACFQKFVDARTKYIFTYSVWCNESGSSGLKARPRCFYRLNFWR